MKFKCQEDLGGRYVANSAPGLARCAAPSLLPRRRRQRPQAKPCPKWLKRETDHPVATQRCQIPTAETPIAVLSSSCGRRERRRGIETYDATREAEDVGDVVVVGGGDGGGERTREDGGARKSWSGCGFELRLAGWGLAQVT